MDIDDDAAFPKRGIMRQAENPNRLETNHRHGHFAVENS